MNMVSYFHRIVVEISTIRFVGGPRQVLIRDIFQACAVRREDVPHDTTFAYKAISA